MSKPPPGERIDHLLRVYRQGDLPGAERLARRLTRKWPRFDLGWNILAATLHATGRLDKAAEAYRTALRLSPDRAALHDSFGALLIQQGRSDQAVARFRDSVRLNPGSAHSQANLALALAAAGTPAEALAPAHRAVEMDPANASHHNALGNVLKALDRSPQAQTAYRTAIDRNPHYAKAHCNLAGLLLDAGLADEAERHYRQAIRANPEYGNAHLGLGNLLAMRGHMDEAAHAYRRVLAAQPGRAEVHRYIAAIKTFRHANDQDFRNLTQRLADPALTDVDRAQLHYAAGKACQDLERPDRAFAHFETGARLKRRQFDYDVAEDEARLQAIARACPKVSPTQTADAVTPVFIVGMPRSGTTLVEQILGAHSLVRAMGERATLPRIVAALDAECGRAYPDWVSSVSQARLAEVAAPHRESVEYDSQGARVYTDKAPENFRYLGIILAAFPNARIVHVRRSPLDICLSCFSQYFSSHVPYSYHLEELGRFFHAYTDLMGHWRQVIPDGLLLEVDYERLTREPERQARRLLEQLGLDWEDGCLAFHNNTRLLQTASVAQARRAVGRDSVGRWRVYESQLAPLARVLGELAW